MAYVIQVLPLLCVQWKTPDDGQRNWPKHVEFYSKNKLEKLVHLVGFIIRIYHDARSPERQNPRTGSYFYIVMWKTLHQSASAYCDLIRHHYTVERQEKQYEIFSPKSDEGNEVTCSSHCCNHALNRLKCWFPLPLHAGTLKSCDVLKIILIFRNLRLDNLDYSYDALSLQEPPTLPIMFSPLIFP